MLFCPKDVFKKVNSEDPDLDLQCLPRPYGTYYLHKLDCTATEDT